MHGIVQLYAILCYTGPRYIKNRLYLNTTNWAVHKGPPTKPFCGNCKGHLTLMLMGVLSLSSRTFSRFQFYHSRKNGTKSWSQKLLSAWFNGWLDVHIWRARTSLCPLFATYNVSYIIFGTPHNVHKCHLACGFVLCCSLPSCRVIGLVYNTHTLT